MTFWQETGNNTMDPKPDSLTIRPEFCIALASRAAPWARSAQGYAEIPQHDGESGNLDRIRLA